MTLDQGTKVSALFGIFELIGDYMKDHANLSSSQRVWHEPEADQMLFQSQGKKR